MLGTLIAFDKNGSDLDTMLKCLWLIRNKGTDDCISRFKFKREMELFDSGTTSMPAVEPVPYVEASRNYYNKTKFMRMFGMIGLIDGSHNYQDLVLTKRGKALLECFDTIIAKSTSGTGYVFSYVKKATKEKTFVSLFIDGLVYGFFGKRNCGLEESKTDIEFPKIMLKAILTLGYVTPAETFYLADGMNEGLHSSFEEAINHLKVLRASPTYKTDIEKHINLFVGGILGSSKKLGRLNLAQDHKIISLLKKINILETISTDPPIHKHYTLTDYAKQNFLGKLQLLLPVYQPQQLILSGVPGTGKSYYVDNIILGGNNNPNNVVRTIIHPDYTYSDFVGYQKPKKNSITGKIEFVFAPGPLTKALERSFCYPSENVYLVIEEVNRGNFAAIMGDTFQLLDRFDDFTSTKHGQSRYQISNHDVYDYLKIKAPTAMSSFAADMIVFPENLHIIGTMNTADQNVFVLDTAFRRRFRNIYLKIDFSDSSDPGSFLHTIDDVASKNIFAGRCTWSEFAALVNKKIDLINADTYIIPEDKKLAPYFVDLDDVSNIQAFCDKVMYYLKSDVFKYVEGYFMESYQQMYQDMVLSPTKKNPVDYI